MCHNCSRTFDRASALFIDGSDEEVIHAVQSANIHSFIETLPMVRTSACGLF